MGNSKSYEEIKENLSDKERTESWGKNKKKAALLQQEIINPTPEGQYELLLQHYERIDFIKYDKTNNKWLGIIKVGRECNHVIVSRRSY
jgi:hypothetical protein